MPEEFEIVREFEVGVPPERVWAALTTGTAGYLWPMDPPEPREGGRGPCGSTVTAWDPPRRYTIRSEDVGRPGQSLDRLDHTVEPLDEGRRARVRHVHNGVFTDDWNKRYDAASKHTNFYLHTLCEYLTHFAPRPAAFARAEGPAASATAGALAAVGHALHLADDAAAGTGVGARGPGGHTLHGVLDYRSPYFIGLRTDSALVRFFGRGHWGAPLGVSVHDFAPGADGRARGAAWQDWLNGVFGRS
ncbi:SRPBCC domain-containing protein [Streptomyces sp. NPDC014684]|uniref:SRPBCC family protein n=1 Tax=Streptomyces sp. NPDC014684 TaxID=3364880 RepID=UPI0036F8D57F